MLIVSLLPPNGVLYAVHHGCTLMASLGIVLGLVIEALNEENILGALKIECPSEAICLLFQFAFKIFS